MDLKTFSVRYPLLRMRLQTLNYWIEPIPARTQFEKKKQWLKNAIKYTQREELQKYVIVVFTETFRTEPIDITGYYGMHAYGKKTEWRGIMLHETNTGELQNNTQG